MKNILFLVLLIAATATYSQGKLRTYTSNDWDYWELNLDGQSGKIRTYTSDDWDYWEYSYGGVSGKIRTYTSEDWDYWEIGRCKLRTYTSNDWDYWEVSGGANLKIRTYTSEDWDYWELTGSVSNLDKDALMAMLFVPIFTSSIHVRGINR